MEVEAAVAEVRAVAAGQPVSTPVTLTLLAPL